MSAILEDRLAEVAALPISSGSHESLERGACVMELVSYVAGEPWSDAPSCACPVITAFLVAWNDGLPDDAARDRLLKPLIPQILASRNSFAEERRSYMALDWLIRVHTPKWLDLVPSLHEHAVALRGLDEIADLAGATSAGLKVRPAGDAAWDAARAAAGAAAAWAVARAAAGAAAAGDAARAAAGAAAARAAAGAAAAGDAAWDAAGAAARAALRPTTEWLQASALDLVRRMLEVK